MVENTYYGYLDYCVYHYDVVFYFLIQMETIINDQPYDTTYKQDKTSQQ